MSFVYEDDASALTSVEQKVWVVLPYVRLGSIDPVLTLLPAPPVEGHTLVEKLQVLWNTSKQKVLLSSKGALSFLLLNLLYLVPKGGFEEESPQ